MRVSTLANAPMSLARIGDQSKCGSCWAFAVVHAIADRICIASKGKLKPLISAQDVMECTDNVTKPFIHDKNSDDREIQGRACSGGWSANAWQRYVDFGVVTGSTEKGSKALGCKPYLFACGLQGGSEYCPDGLKLTLRCERACENDDYQIANLPDSQEKYKADRHFGQEVVSLPANDAENIEKVKRVLYNQGSVTAGIDADIIQKLTDNEEKILTEKGKEENHSIRIIGWGKSAKFGPYWIIANSYNSNWNGDGTMKVAFGAAFLAQEQEVIFAKPKLPSM